MLHGDADGGRQCGQGTATHSNTRLHQAASRQGETQCHLWPQRLCCLDRKPLQLVDKAALKVLQQQDGLSRLACACSAPHPVNVLRPVRRKTNLCRRTDTSALRACLGQREFASQHQIQPIAAYVHLQPICRSHPPNAHRKPGFK